MQKKGRLCSNPIPTHEKRIDLNNDESKVKNKGKYRHRLINKLLMSARSKFGCIRDRHSHSQRTKTNKQLFYLLLHRRYIRFELNFLNIQLETAKGPKIVFTMKRSLCTFGKLNYDKLFVRDVKEKFSIVFRLNQRGE